MWKGCNDGKRDAGGGVLLDNGLPAPEHAEVFVWVGCAEVEAAEGFDAGKGLVALVGASAGK